MSSRRADHLEVCITGKRICRILSVDFRGIFKSTDCLYRRALTFEPPSQPHPPPPGGSTPPPPAPANPFSTSSTLCVPKKWPGKRFFRKNFIHLPPSSSDLQGSGPHCPPSSAVPAQCPIASGAPPPLALPTPLPPGPVEVSGLVATGGGGPKGWGGAGGLQCSRGTPRLCPLLCAPTECPSGQTCPAGTQIAIPEELTRRCITYPHGTPPLHNRITSYLRSGTPTRGRGGRMHRPHRGPRVLHRFQDIKVVVPRASPGFPLCPCGRDVLEGGGGGVGVCRGGLAGTPLLPGSL